MRGVAILLLAFGLLGCKYDVDSVRLADLKPPDVKRDAVPLIKEGDYTGKWYVGQMAQLGGDVTMKLTRTGAALIVTITAGTIDYKGEVDAAGSLKVLSLDRNGALDGRGWMSSKVYGRDDRGYPCWMQGDWSVTVLTSTTTGVWWACTF
jgi:hypothetical protein